MPRSHLTRFPVALFSLLTLLLLIGCGGTKVYDTSKTIVYNGDIYQVTDVSTISTSITGRTQDGQEINLKNRDRDEMQELIEANDPLYVRMAFDLDEEDLVYFAGDVESWRDYDRLLSRYENAGKDIAKLMAEKKTEQLKLR